VKQNTKKILILCTGNSCRSQMAEGFFKSFDNHLTVYSAGTNPTTEVHKYAIEVMKELGIDISNHTPKNIEKYINLSFDYVITVCDHAKETCPVFTGKVKKRIHIGFDDPAEATGSKTKIINEFRRVRNEILIQSYRLYHTEIKL